MKAYLRRGKNDAADAVAICEAVRRPTMRFVPIKTEDQQAALMLHKAQELLVRQQTMLINALRGPVAELGMVAPQGRGRIEDLVAVIEDAEIKAWHRGNEASRRLPTIPGVVLRRRLPDPGMPAIA